ncbi:zinc-dependent alcohol dehydrogenase family protein [Halocalculus aciditolerans]|uniref:Alcohol dehydrogenase n=1 Tax=Halocalculus aciditolerans TaxID=1383812 RepID=A0A830F968_9EURY|nr:zinc-dependent alcohol dehydrogenase family protein [Halocalculus aciditolerans]GGL52218.1 alcohol dehydrogenase [Halocalculus aciditolerans]
MKAAVLREYGEPLAIEERARPEPAPDGVVVEVEACGICRSDWHAWKGHGEWADDRVEPGTVLGHEPAGRVVEAGERVERFGVGDRVAVPFSLGDGTCPYCREGKGNVCQDGWALGFEPDADGAFAEYVAVPVADYNLAALPDSVSFEAAAALGCRYMTAFHALAERVAVDSGDWVAVHGCGGVGLSAVQIARSRGANVIAVDLSEEKLDAARDAGAHETVNVQDVDDPATAVRDIAGDGGAHVSMDAVGVRATCRASVGSLRDQGTHVQVGLTTEEERGEVSLPTDYMTRHELSFVGARGMPPTSYDALFRLVETGDVAPAALVTKEVSLEAVPDRLAAMDDYGTVGVEVVTDF